MSSATSGGGNEPTGDSPGTAGTTTAGSSGGETDSDPPPTDDGPPPEDVDVTDDVDATDDVDGTDDVDATDDEGPTDSMDDVDDGNVGGPDETQGDDESADDADGVEEPIAEDAGVPDDALDDTSEPGPDDEITIPDKFVGNITTGNSVDPQGYSFAAHWDQITPENAGKWGSVQPNAGGDYNWSTLDAIYDYAEENGIVFKQHTFVWGNQQPRGTIGEADVKDWMRSFCERYPRTAMIDVVNEPPPHTTPSYADAIGGGTNGSWQWITNSFLWAREACPKAILILNDYNNIEWPNDHNHFVNIVRTIMAAGAPVDALGAQAHDLDNGAVSFDRVKGFLQALHDESGLPVYITEYDISTTDDNAQLRTYQEQVTHFRSLDFVPGITIWGWIYGRTWSSAPNSGLIRDGSPRPAMTWLMEELGRPVP